MDITRVKNKWKTWLIMERKSKGMSEYSPTEEQCQNNRKVWKSDSNGPY